MRISFIFIATVIFFCRSVAQSPDTTIYSFTVKLAKNGTGGHTCIFNGGWLCGESAAATVALYKYQVLESNYKFPLSQVTMLHYCFEKDLSDSQSIYKVIAKVYKESDNLSFFSVIPVMNKNMLAFKPVYVYEDYLFKYKHLISKTHQ